MLIEKFLNYLNNERNYSRHTVDAYHNDLVQFFYILNLETSLLARVKVKDIRSWIIYLKNKNNSTRTINRKISALKTFFNFCKREQYVSTNPLLKIKTMKEAKRLPVILSESSLENLFSLKGLFSNSFKGCRDRLVLELFYQTGIRLTELIGIKIHDYDNQKKELKILGKRNKERVIPLTNSLLKLLDHYLELRYELLDDKKQSFLFVTSGGQQTYPKMIYRIVNYYLSMVSSSERRSPHVLRHAFATHLLNRGADLNAIKDLLGHSTLLSTQVYTQISSTKIKKVYKKAHPRG